MDTLGPVVRVDLGEVVPVGQPVTLRFRWGGALVTPEGGPLPTKRLAYVGSDGSYLMYAARWYPFHDYAADRATADITVIAPAGLQVAGSGDEPPTQSPGARGTIRVRFVAPSAGSCRQYCGRSLRQPKSQIWKLRSAVCRQAGQREHD
ncbi:MAG: hypothetical protein WKF84_02140 [Pyrinomonadaceae bacterium]